MREQLIQYVSLLFAGAEDCEDIKQEILQNTLDRYDDLIAEGKAPEAAYRLAITGIGDINEILGTKPQSIAPAYAPDSKEESSDTPTKKWMRAIAVGLYIISFLPLFILSEMGMDTIGFCGTLSIIAVATVLMILGAKKGPAERKEVQAPLSPQQELRKSVHDMIWTVGLVLYFVLSFVTMAWHTTWIMFPLIRAVQSLAKAIFDLKEANDNET
ncbi:MAG: hypothetical protein IJ001_02055 [Oscillospiraceae bacterium]|nr:hypothetical protein [Oscillospiraceae bacterium]